MAYGPLRTHFISRKHITIDDDLCVGCKLCMRNCPMGSTVLGYRDAERKAYVKNPHLCGGCGACLRGCPPGAIHLAEERREGMLTYHRVKPAFAPGQHKPRP